MYMKDYMDDFKQKSKVIRRHFLGHVQHCPSNWKAAPPSRFSRQWAHGLCTNTSLAFLVQVCGLGSRSEWCFHHRYLGGFERYDGTFLVLVLCVCLTDHLQYLHILILTESVWLFSFFCCLSLLARWLKKAMGNGFVLTAGMQEPTVDESPPCFSYLSHLR